MSEQIPTVTIQWPNGEDQPPVIYPFMGSAEEDDAIRALLEKALWAYHAG